MDADDFDIVLFNCVRLVVGSVFLMPGLDVANILGCKLSVSGIVDALTLFYSLLFLLALSVF